jgi:radical SAM protein with 4Fe4S-binding SPASM domain
MQTLRRHAPGYNFVGNPETGFTARWGASIVQDPRWAPWPELVDISISNRCSKGCDFCYRDSTPEGGWMGLAAYEYVLTCLTSPQWGPPFQVAIGGGEPLEHPEFLPILDATKKRGIVANFTTNGQFLDAAMAKAVSGRVGAVALSAMGLSDFDASKARLLANAGVRTNLHFILDRHTLSQAVEIACGKHDALLKDLSGVVFLTRKPKGRSGAEGILEFGDPRLKTFLDAVSASTSKIPLGFDACAVPLLLNHGGIDPRTVDACECGFFSVYVDENLDVRPCSFSGNPADAWSLLEWDFGSIWTDLYAAYRDRQSADSCARDCVGRDHCRGKCPLFEEISFCHRKAAP